MAPWRAKKPSEGESTPLTAPAAASQRSGAPPTGQLQGGGMVAAGGVISSSNANGERVGGMGKSFEVDGREGGAAGKSPAKTTKQLTREDAKRAEAKAASLRFKLNTPPKATVEATGIYTDRSANRKHGGRPTSDGPVRRTKKNATEASFARGKENEHGRIPWKDEEQTKVNEEIFNGPPPPRAIDHELPDFTGEWICSSASGDWDEFLSLLEVPSFTRKLAKARSWGVGNTEQKIVSTYNKSNIQIWNHHRKMKYTTTHEGQLKPKDDVEEIDSFTDKKKKKDNGPVGPDLGPAAVLKINGATQVITFEGFTGSGRLSWEGRALVTRMELPKLGPCVVKRTLSPDMVSMTIDLYVSYIHATRTYSLRRDYVY